MTYQYHAFGLNIHSSIEIPEFLSSKGEPDVTIRFGKVPDALEKPKKQGVRFQASPGLFLLKVDDIAKYLVSEGNQILIEAYPGADSQDIRLFTLGSVFGALIHQRGMLPLHASAISGNSGCVIFCGASGNGKSTIARKFVKRGYHLHTDDICVISVDNNGMPIVYPGYPQFKLWEDALEKIGDTEAPYSRVRQVLDKYAVPAKERFNDNPLPLKKIYILVPHNEKEFKIFPLSGMDKFNAMKNNTYRFKFIEGLGQEASHFKTAGIVGKQTPICRVLRPKKPYLLDQLADLLETDFKEIDGNGLNI